MLREVSTHLPAYDFGIKKDVMSIKTFQTRYFCSAFERVDDKLPFTFSFANERHTKNGRISFASLQRQHLKIEFV